MINKISTLAVLSSAVALSGIGCTKDKQEGLSSVETSIKMRGTTVPGLVASSQKPLFLEELFFPKANAYTALSMEDSQGNVVNLSQAWMVVTDVEFEVDDDNLPEGVEDLEFEELPGPYGVDLLSSEPLSFGQIALPDLAYRNLNMRLQAAETTFAGAPAGLSGNCIYLAGTVGTNDFEFQADEDDHYEVTGPSGFNPAEGQDLLIVVNLADLFKKIDMSALPDGAVINSTNRFPGSNLCPSIKESADDIYECITRGLGKQSLIGNDEDDDGDLDEGEVEHDDEEDEE